MKKKEQKINKLITKITMDNTIEVKISPVLVFLFDLMNLDLLKT